MSWHLGSPRARRAYANYAFSSWRDPFCPPHSHAVGIHRFGSVVAFDSLVCSDCGYGRMDQLR